MNAIGCTTGGEIISDEVFDNAVVVTAIEFERSEVRVASTALKDEGDSYRSGLRLGKELVGENLSTIFVLSDGTHVNGSELVRGIVEIVGNEIPVTGGMAGDGDRFGTTLVGVDDVPRDRDLRSVDSRWPRQHRWVDGFWSRTADYALEG